MKIRRLTQRGAAEFLHRLKSLDGKERSRRIRELAGDATLTRAVETDVEIETEISGRRLEAGKYLLEVLGRGKHTGVAGNRYVWGWLAAVWFDHIWPSAKKVRSDARWIYRDDDAGRSYRHFLAGPYNICRAHADDPDRAWPVLTTPLHAPGEIAEQLSASSDLVTNRVVMEVATELYFTKETRARKAGAAGKGPGSVRRLVAVLKQLEVTWDLGELSQERLMKLLPGEFDGFRKDGE